MRFNNSRKHELGRRTTPRNQLIGKVVLLIGNDSAVLQTLIMQLAQKGADIALLCRKLPTETIRLIEAQVESLGRRLLLLTESELFSSKQAAANPVELLLQKIGSVFGRLDVFIDLSAKEEDDADETAVVELVPDPIQPSWQVRQAILAELVHTN